YLWRPEEGVRSLETRVTGSSEQSGGYWESNPGPLDEQPVLLTTEPSLSPLESCCCSVTFIYLFIYLFTYLFIYRVHMCMCLCVGMSQGMCGGQTTDNLHL
ncbi:mCG144933, partial [Mus musculus]